MGNFKNENNYTKSIPVALVYDSTLSDRARFVYVFMTCKADDWSFFLEPMAKEIGYSVDTLRKYINELIASGWLIKGEQQNENGKFGAVEYTLKATKFTDTENFRHGKNMTQENIYNISLPNTKDNDNKEKKKEEIKEEIKEKSDSLFETCWVAYRRKGKKGKAKPYWDKLSANEKDSVLQHIKIYTKTRELQYQQDFERYLRDKTFLSVVVSKNNVVYDPTKLGEGESASNVYMPSGNFSIMWDDQLKAYLYIGYYSDGQSIADGYTDSTRPDGARIVLNNGRGELVWSSITRTWIKQ